MGNKKIQILVFAVLILSTFSIGIVSSQDGSPWPRVENISVTPPKGYYNDVFNFSLAMLYFNNTTIELEIPHAITTKTLRKTGKYTNPEKWQPIRWNVTFDPSWEGMIANYKIYWSGREIAQEAGPFIIPRVTAEFKNASVVPEAGYYNTLYTYSVWVNLNKREEIALEVYNMSSKKWEMRGNNQSNTKLSVPEKLTWSPITNIASADCIGGLGKFRFVFRDVNSSESYESEIYRDPFLLPPTEVKRFKNIFKNATVTPSSGGYNTSFDYSVEPVDVLNYVSNVSDIHLVVWNPHTWKEQNFENATLANSSLKWSIKPFENDKKCKGFAQYYFTYNGTRWPETVPLYGPAINMTGPPGPSGSGGGGGGGGYYEPWITYKNATVDPNVMLIDIRGEKKTFNYSVIVNKDVTLILEIYNLSSNEWEEVGEDKKSELEGEWGKGKHEWSVNLALDTSWKGICKYQFYPKDLKRYESQVYYGPEILLAEEWISGWKKEIGVADKRLKRPTITCTVSPNEGRWFEKFTYTARIRHLDGVNMTLALFVYKPGSEDWALVPWKPYRDTALVEEKDYEAGIAIVEWEAEGIFDEDDANKPPYNYYIWYYDGYNEDEVSFTGPKNVRINHEPEIVDVSVTPENGSVRSVYLYRAELYDHDIEDIVFITLYVKDPLGAVIPIAMKEIEIKNSRGNETWIISPELGVFSWKKLIEYINTTGNASFMSSYRFEYYDEGMIVARNEHKWTDWIPRPDVSLVKVELMHLDVEPKEGTYADEFVYSAQFYSSEENIVTVKLLIYDPSNPKNVQNLSARLTIPADASNVISWEVKPEVFSSDDFGKTASYRILWEDQFGNNGTTNLISGPSIAKAVPIVTNSYLPIIIVLSLVFIPLAYSGIKRLRGEE